MASETILPAARIRLSIDSTSAYTDPGIPVKDASFLYLFIEPGNCDRGVVNIVRRMPIMQPLLNIRA